MWPSAPGSVSQIYPAEVASLELRDGFGVTCPAFERCLGVAVSHGQLWHTVEFDEFP